MDKKSFFNALAAGWDDRFYTPEMQERLKGLVSDFGLKSASRVLDIGTGTGGLIPYILNAIGPSGSVEAVDFAEEMVEIGRKKFKDQARVSFHLSAIESMPFEDEGFDYVICFGTFPHLDDKERALAEISRVLKQGGTLIVAHALSSAEIRAHHQGADPVSRDFLPAEPEMRQLLRSRGFEVVRLIDRSGYYLCEGIKIGDFGNQKRAPLPRWERKG